MQGLRLGQHASEAQHYRNQQGRHAQRNQLCEKQHAGTHQNQQGDPCLLRQGKCVAAQPEEQAGRCHHGNTGHGLPFTAILWPSRAHCQIRVMPGISRASERMAISPPVSLSKASGHSIGLRSRGRFIPDRVSMKIDISMEDTPPAFSLDHLDLLWKIICCRERFSGHLCVQRGCR